MILRDDLLAQGYVEVWHRFGSVYYEDINKIVFAKVCTKCSTLKTVESFNKKANGIGGKEAHCRKCSALKAKTWRGNKVEHITKMNEVYREDRRQNSINWRENNPERKKEYLQMWRADNPEKKRLSDNIRRERILSLPDDFTREQQEFVYGYFGGCALTNHPIIQWDHTIPVCVGHGGRTLVNMVPLRPDLNTSKNGANVFEWFDNNKNRFNLSQSKFDALIEYLAEVNEMSTKEYRMYVDWCHDNPRSIEDINNGKEAM